MVRSECSIPMFSSNTIHLPFLSTAIQFTVDKEAILSEEMKKKAVVSGREKIGLPTQSPARIIAQPLVNNATLGQAEEEEECLNCGA